MDYGAPKIDFGMLANLGKTFDASRENQARFDANAQRQEVLRKLGGSGNLEDIGRGLMQAGDAETGGMLLRLAEAEKNRAADVSYRNERAAVADRQHAEGTYGITGKDEFGEETYGWRRPDGSGKQMPNIQVPATPLPAPAPAPPSPDMPAPGATENQYVIPGQQPATPPAPPAPVAPQAAPDIIPGLGVTREQLMNTSKADLVPLARQIGVSPGSLLKAKEALVSETIKGGAGKALTESQSKDALFVTKMQGAEREYQPREKDTMSVGGAALNATGRAFQAEGSSGWLTNKLTPEGYQSGMAARREWIAALLRRVSGAAVLPSEFDMYNDIYFPSPGQSEGIARQKARARERALDGLKMGLPPDRIVAMSNSAPPRAPGQPGEPLSNSLKTSTGINASW